MVSKGVKEECPELELMKLMKEWSPPKVKVGGVGCSLYVVVESFFVG